MGLYNEIIDRCSLTSKKVGKMLLLGSMEHSLMVSVATFGPGDPGSNPSHFAVSNSNQKLSFPNSISMLHSSKYCNLVMGDT